MNDKQQTLLGLQQQTFSFAKGKWLSGTDDSHLDGSGLKSIFLHCLFLVTQITIYINIKFNIREEMKFINLTNWHQKYSRPTYMWNKNCHCLSSVNTPAHNPKPGVLSSISTESDCPGVIPQGDQTIQELTSCLRRYFF